MDTTLTAVCRSIRNYFTRTAEQGSYIIESGRIQPVTGEYLAGQYVRITGSLLNDGVARIQAVGDGYIEISIPGIGASDEAFEGGIHGLAIPQDFLAVVDDIRAFNERQKGANSDLVSESIGNYSYSRATGKNGAPATWTEAFASRLNPWRRMFDEGNT